MAHRVPRKSGKGSTSKLTPQEGSFHDVEGGVNHQRKQGRRQSNSKGPPPTPAQGKKSSATPSHATRLTGGPSTRAEASAVHGSVMGGQSVEGRSPKGRGAGRGLTNRTGGGHAASRVATQLSSQHQPVALRFRGANQTQVGSRHQPGRPGSDVPSSGDGQWSGRGRGGGRGGKAQRQTPSLRAAATSRTYGELMTSKQPALGGVGEDRRTRIMSVDAAQVPSSVLRETRGGRTAAGHSLSQNVHATDQGSSRRPGRSQTRKRGRQSHPEQSSAQSHSALAQLGHKTEPPSKRMCYSDNRPVSVETDRRLFGKKSFLRRAQEDMLASGSTSTERNGGETTTSGSKAGLSEVQDAGRPVTRRSLHSASSTRLRNYRYHGAARRSGLSLTENQGGHPGSVSSVGSQKASATSSLVSLEMQTRGRKRGRGGERVSQLKPESGSLGLGNGLSPAQKKARVSSAGRRAGMPSGEERGRPPQKTPHALPSKKTATRGGKLCDVGTEQPSTSTCWAAVRNNRRRKGKAVVHCGENSGDRPRRTVSQKKKCECCEFGVEHFSDGSLVDSDTELEKSAGKDEDRAWRSSVRPSRPKGGGGAARKGRGGRRGRNRKSLAGLSTATGGKLSSGHGQLMAYAYPVQLHTSSFKQEFARPVMLHCSEKEEVKPDEAWLKSSGDVKEEAGPVSRPELFTFNQDAKLPGEIAYMEEDFYVVVADSDADEDTDVTLRDTSAEDVKQDIESSVLEDVKQDIESSVLEDVKQDIESSVLEDVKQDIESSVLEDVKRDTESMVIEDMKQNAESTVIAGKEESDCEMTSDLCTADNPWKEEKELAVVMTSSCREGSVEHAAETSVTAQKEDKENVPLTASSSELHSPSEQIQKSSLTAQKAEPHSKNPESLSAVEALVQSGQVAETEAEVHGSKEERNSGAEQGLQNTLAAQAVETGVGDQPIEPSPEMAHISPQDHAVPSDGPEPQAETLSASPAREEDWTQRCLASAALERQMSGDQMVSGKKSEDQMVSNKHNSEPSSGVGASSSRPAVTCADVPEINIPIFNSASNLLKESDHTMSDNTAGPSYQSVVEASTCKGKDQAVIPNTAFPGEHPEQFYLEGKGTAGVNPAEASQVVNPRDQASDLVTARQEDAEVLHCREEAAQAITSAESSQIVTRGENNLQQTTTEDDDSAQDDEVVLIPMEITNPAQADKRVAPLRQDHPVQTGDTGAENSTEGLNGNCPAARPCDLQQDCGMVGEEEDAHTVCMVGGSGQENSQRGCMDFSAAENYSLQSLQNHSATAWEEGRLQGSSNSECTAEVRDVQCKQVSGEELCVQKPDETGAGEEPYSEGCDKTQEATDTEEGQGSGLVTVTTTEKTVTAAERTYDQTSAGTLVEEQGLNSRESRDFPESAHGEWQDQKVCAV